MLLSERDARLVRHNLSIVADYRRTHNHLKSTDTGWTNDETELAKRLDAFIQDTEELGSHVERVGVVNGHNIVRAYANGMYTGTGENTAMTAGDVFYTRAHVQAAHPGAYTMTGYRYVGQPQSAPDLFETLDDLVSYLERHPEF